MDWKSGRLVGLEIENASRVLHADLLKRKKRSLIPVRFRRGNPTGD
jgi:hypothetical protein